MNKLLTKVKTRGYDQCQWQIEDFKLESESQEYKACKFELNDLKIISRNAKITPKKVGQFVTLWKRNSKGKTAPLDNSENFDFCIINVEDEEIIGQFVFPKSVLIEKGILSSSIKEGKRGFRVYPTWCKVTSKQALKTQAWQQLYFCSLNQNVDFERIKALYNGA